MRLEGKVALISGGARGQGAAEAKLFAKEDARVVFGDILDQQGRQVEAEILEMGGEAVYLHLDVTSEGQWQAAVARPPRSGSVSCCCPLIWFHWNGSGRR